MVGSLVSICFAFALTIIDGERADLSPSAQQWQAYPSDIENVVIGAKGRAWLQSNRRVSLAEAKKQVEAAADWEIPWTVGMRLRHIDRTGRIWMTSTEMGYEVLFAYDQTTKTWLEHKATDLSPVKSPSAKSRYHHFRGNVFESRTGRIYFGDGLGVHVFEEKTWKYQPLFERNIAKKNYYGGIRAFSDPQFAQDEVGNVYVYARWGTMGRAGTIGFWRHDGERWKQIVDGPNGVKLERLDAIMPLADGAVLVCPEDKPMLRISFRPVRNLEPEIKRLVDRLDDPKYEVRQEASRALLNLGSDIVPQLRHALEAESRPETQMRLRRLVNQPKKIPPYERIDGHHFRFVRRVGADTKGNWWFWTGHGYKIGTDLKQGRKTWRITPDGKVTGGWDMLYAGSAFFEADKYVYIAYSSKGCIRYDENGQGEPVTDSTQNKFRYVLGRDRKGRVYLSNGRDIAAWRAPEQTDKPHR